MHLGKEQSTGIAADVDDVRTADAPVTPAPERDEREPRPTTAPAEQPAPIAGR